MSVLQHLKLRLLAVPAVLVCVLVFGGEAAAQTPDTPSITSVTERPHPEELRAVSRGRDGASASGSSTIMVVDSPSSVSTRIRPPCCRAMSLESARPRPVP